jgi:ubiquinone biosynthesis protein COQ4
MAETRYAYSSAPTRNPFRYLLALWRTVRDPSATSEVAIVQMGFARSRLGRRFARWEDVVVSLKRDPRTAPAVRERRPCEPIDVEALARLPEGTLGRAFSDHCRAIGLDPNLIHIPPVSDVDWMLHHAYLTHDVWHVVTGWGNDENGEYGLGAFYLAQLAAPSFFGFLLSLAGFSTVLRRRPFGPFMEAIVTGYEMGRRAEPLFGVDWSTLWQLPLADVRMRFGIGAEGPIGEGIDATAA